MVVETETKNSLRKNLLQKLLSLTAKEVERRSKYVEKQISKLSIYKSAKIVMGFYPLRGEVNLLGMFRDGIKSGKIFCFPVIDMATEEIIPYRVDNLENFTPGPLGTKEPIKEKSLRIEINEIDLILVPGVAFSVSGYRLGRGKGFYDRFLKILPKKAIRLGVAFNFQILNAIPINPAHDQRVDYIVSEENIY